MIMGGMASTSSAPSRPFASASVAAGTHPASVALPGPDGWLRATNASASIAFIGVGTTRAAATSCAGIAVAPGQTVRLPAPSSITYVAARLAFGAGGIFFNRTGERAADGVQ